MIKIHPNDNIEVNIQSVEVRAVQEIAQGEHIVLYGIPIAVATHTIKNGSILSDADVQVMQAADVVEKITPIPDLPNPNLWKHKTFKGYYRTDGSVGTANYWLVIPMVFCENRNVEIMRDAMMHQLGYQRSNQYHSLVKSLIHSYHQQHTADDMLKINTEEILFDKQDILFPNVDGIRFLTHQGGCGGTRQDANALCGLFAGYITHPNVAGATVLSLGCQNAQVEILLDEIKKRNPAFDKPLYMLDQQQTGEEKDLISQAIKQTLEGLKEANKNVRTEAPLSKLCLGLESGNLNNSFVNAAIGRVSDRFVSLGAGIVLSQLTHLKTVEQEVIKRCIHEEDKNRFRELMSKYIPSPEKNSLQSIIVAAGALAKAGHSPIVSVLDFPKKISSGGLQVLCTPNDTDISITATAGSGANLILLTTKDANEAVNNPIAPVIKMTDNNSVSENNDAVINVDAGAFLNENNALENAAEALIDLICSIASGNKKTVADIAADNNFIPWKRGISL